MSKIRSLVLIALVAGSLAPAGAAEPPAELPDSTADQRSSVSVTVYNVNLALVRETRSTWTEASPEAVFGVVSSIGGERGWLFWEWAWNLRGLLDRLIGGPGLRRGRRHPTELIPGDAVDFWRVESVDPPHLLRLRAEMKLPGKAWLQWETIPERGGTRLVQTALFAPVGLTGMLYWKSLYPVHKIMFSGMVNSIARAAKPDGP